MKNLLLRLRGFFFPQKDKPVWAQLFPYFALLGLVAVVFLASTFSWEYTNSREFCGLACHTMPPQYLTYLSSPHDRVSCDECHMGRAPFATQLVRKFHYSKATGMAMVTGNYEYPIRANEMRPANEACETCHYPATFSGDKMVTLSRYQEDEANTLSRTYLLLKIGGGSKREGMGYGIHWHVENPIEFIATDADRQKIPYIRMKKENGEVVEYVDVESKFDTSAVKEDQLQTMDCITCHNRTAHNIFPPGEQIDRLLMQKRISTDIPDIRRKALEVLSATYPDYATADSAISGLKDFYKKDYADFSAKNGALLDAAVKELQITYAASVFIDQKMDWKTHPNNIGHSSAPGCFRCHDGKHLNKNKEAIRLECNLCHSIPVKAAAKDQVTRVEIDQSFEPPSHLDTNWIALHRSEYNDTCKTCHTTDNPGGNDNTSFCSNSVCHGSSWTYAGFDAPALRETLKKEPTPSPKPTSESGAPAGNNALTYDGAIGALLKERCGTCHGDAATDGIKLTSYADALKSGETGAAIVPNNADTSLLVKVQKAGGHPGQFSPEELDKVTGWIKAGAPEK